ncbi:MAG: bifunctional methylenetetrahydrofolate dehydrogenase/methenyltetrahydrofolate cyclohydrolase [Gammaproteobacteria bacterium RIFCSPHIGHO2_12_FULL_42_10]|nr:MAG: bifunctional methylenetetrahydrofolate dehydrogenase/methenyltetrahydrofolate cyclohydrolase [Gammaproteobacteria bacterium RIFCSPHIGHO2_12_FULL_42_10]
MTANIIDGKSVASTLKARLKHTLQAECNKDKQTPGLAVIIVGEDPASVIYVRNKRLGCEEIGIHSHHYALPVETTEQYLIDLIRQLNADPTIHGILIQTPLPQHVNAQTLVECIDPHKDVDGFHPYNLGRLAQRKPLLRPCTPFGVMMLLDHIQQVYKNKHAVIVGASNSVGRPMAFELLIAGATVTLCHRFTSDLSYFIRQADILVAAVGRAGLITGKDIKEGATVIDVGISRLPNGKLTGDVEFSVASERAAWITPVPGGVGPMTVAVLLYNTLLAAGFTISAEPL